MRFWDSSAIVPLLVAEAASARAAALLRRDPDVLVWWGTEVECAAAIARREREGLPRQTAKVLRRRLRELADGWREVEPTDALRLDAGRLLRIHPLRAADSLQLAAARAACRLQPDGLPFVCADGRLAAAALREGLDVVDPLSEPPGS